MLNSRMCCFINTYFISIEITHHQRCLILVARHSIPTNGHHPPSTTPSNFKETNRIVGLVGQVVGTPFEGHQDDDMSSEEPSQVVVEMRQTAVGSLAQSHNNP